MATGASESLHFGMHGVTSVHGAVSLHACTFSPAHYAQRTMHSACCGISLVLSGMRCVLVDVTTWKCCIMRVG